MWTHQWTTNRRNVLQPIDIHQKRLYSAWVVLVLARLKRAHIGRSGIEMALETLLMLPRWRSGASSIRRWCICAVVLRRTSFCCWLGGQEGRQPPRDYELSFTTACQLSWFCTKSVTQCQQWPVWHSWFRCLLEEKPDDTDSIGWAKVSIRRARWRHFKKWT